MSEQEQAQDKLSNTGAHDPNFLFLGVRERLKQLAETLQKEAVRDKVAARKAARVKVVQSLLRIAESRAVKTLRMYGD